MLRYERVSYTYPDGNRALHDVSFLGNAGELLLLGGHNGAGQSSLLKLLNGILRPTEGKVFVNGLSTQEHSTATLAAHVAVTFQNPGDQLFAASVEEEISFGCRNLRRSDQELIQQTITLFDFQHETSAHPYDLPLSRRKLLTIASAVAMGSPIIALDEPSAGLSLPERALLVHALSTLRTQGRLILVASHDVEVFLPLASRLLVLDHGRLVFDGRPKDFADNPHVLRSSGIKLPLATRLHQALSLHRSREQGDYP
jgi:energy-coupling factor transport system ATP-binding protein